MNKLKPAALAALAMALFLVMAGPAAARSRDRNHDRIPDRWEVKHHLSLHVNQARRDQDRDGLRNRAEFKAGLNPRDADTDNDGIEDGDEHAGTIQSFDHGLLTIALFGGGTLSGQVTDATEIECEGAETSSHGGDDSSGDDHSGSGSGDDQSGDDQSGDQNDDQAEDQNDDQAEDQNDDQGEDQDNDDQDENAQASCGTDQLTAGREVDEAELRLSNGTATFKEVKLAP